jgi:putative redox protein
MSGIRVDHLEHDRFLVSIRGHELLVDQPSADDEIGPTPTELFVAGLAACVAFYGQRFLRRHGVPRGLRVESGFEMAERPTRVERVWIRVHVAGPLSGQLRTALERVVDQCTVHNSLRQPPVVEITLEEAAEAA